MGVMRHVRSQKGSGFSTLTANTVIERLRKIRALNSSPALFGIDSIVLKKIAKNLYTFTK
jgi:hypothetical protein